jgi:hypothetical protein
MHTRGGILELGDYTGHGCCRVLAVLALLPSRTWCIHKMTTHHEIRFVFVVATNNLRARDSKRGWHWQFRITIRQKSNWSEQKPRLPNHMKSMESGRGPHLEAEERRSQWYSCGSARAAQEAAAKDLGNQVGRWWRLGWQWGRGTGDPFLPARGTGGKGLTWSWIPRSPDLRARHCP